VITERAEHARELFDGIARAYDRPADILSLWQYARWRRALVRAMAIAPGARVLDVATGTGLVAADLEAAGAHVTGLDQSREMIAASRGRSARPLVRADATKLPFADASFDALTFSYLLRYVDDPAATVAELARVVRPGGAIGSVEFGVPSWQPATAGWRAYAQGVFPLAARAFGSEWRGVGEFLPRSIVEWARAWPPARQMQAWRAAGIENVAVKKLTLGTGVVMWGRKR
jgi:demethylmenaquinone methyltransferase/2-methoxy-6-polyprenyl-1,4-benzoquinol methylase